MNLSINNMACRLRHHSRLLALGVLAISPSLLNAQKQDNDTMGDTQPVQSRSVEDATTVLDVGSKDPETLRFEAALTQHALGKNVIASFVYSFQLASPEGRAQLWHELEKDKAEAAKLKNQQAVKTLKMKADPQHEYDAETLRYAEVVNNLDLPPDAVQDLVEMFYSNEAPFRKVLWQRAIESPLNKN